jgi:hypothetical protein
LTEPVEGHCRGFLRESTVPKTIRHSSVVLTLVSALASVIPQVARADDAEPPALPPAIRRALTWLPEDTESIVVGQALTIRAPDMRGATERTVKKMKEEFHTYAQEMAFGAINEPEMAKYLKPLAGKKATLALRGGRNCEWVTSTLPTYRTEGCAVLIFEEELGEAGEEWIDALRKGAEAVREIAGRKVFVFPPTKSMRPARKSEWPGKLGVYLVLLNSNTILCATSDKYLEQLLERIDTPPADRALPDHLPEWKHVNSVAPAWMMRHLSKRKSRPMIQGVTWWVTKEQIRVAYVPITGEHERTANEVRRSWQPETDAVLQPVDWAAIIESLEDGAVLVSSTIENLNSDTFLGLSLLNLYYAEAQSSNLD